MINHLLDVVDNSTHTMPPDTKAVFIAVVITFILLIVKNRKEPIN